MFHRPVCINSIVVLTGAFLCGACTTYSPCQSIVSSAKYSGYQDHKAMVTGGNRCYWSWSKPDLRTASGDAMARCRVRHQDCRVVAIGNSYVGQSQSQIDYQTLANVATIAGGVAVGYQAAQQGQSMPYVPYMPYTPSTGGTPTSTSLSGNCSAQMKQLEMEARAPLYGGCQAAKHQVQFFRKAIVIVSRCKMLDPDGQQQALYKRHLSHAKNLVRDTCAPGAY